MEQEIDFVIPWVDGDDPEWKKSKAMYAGNVQDGNEVERFREWDQLKYWFRGVEKFSPWVNRIYFVTCGHLPEWLNVEHPKLCIVKHSDYIPSEYLPTFSANPIELNFHRIEGLSEQFVYFNDDIFLINHVAPQDFFVDGIPCSTAGLSIPMQVSHQFAGILMSDYSLINANFNSRDVIHNHFWKFVNPRYGFKRNLQTLLLLPYCTHGFPGFYNSHGPNPLLKSVFEEVWDKNRDKLNETCIHKFRSFNDVNQYVFLWWQWCKGLVKPKNLRKFQTYLTVLSPNDQLEDVIMNQKSKVLIINDDWVDDFEGKKKMINSAFDIILGDKSSFEI